MMRTTPASFDTFDAAAAAPDMVEKSAIQLPLPAAATPTETIAAMEALLGVVQHVATILEQALNNRRWSWGRLVYLGECHAKAISYVDMLRGYHKAGDAAISYLDEDLQYLLQVPHLADQMLASFQGKAKLNAALHFLHGLDAELTRN